MYAQMAFTVIHKTVSHAKSVNVAVTLIRIASGIAIRSLVNAANVSIIRWASPARNVSLAIGAMHCWSQKETVKHADALLQELNDRQLIIHYWNVVRAMDNATVSHTLLARNVTNAKYVGHISSIHIADNLQ
ncbi:unnamed protein product [Anisakis simplex]|uniref:Secreted protein n=1 Tax=Anisakis simplex TaxID=6269 RepID=A0A0M3KE59_ANISI|nr:unnamed protein product [Anisakis simplex]